MYLLYQSPFIKSPTLDCILESGKNEDVHNIANA